LAPVTISGVDTLSSQTYFGFLLNGALGSGGNVRAQLGALQTQVTFSSQRNSAADVTAVLASFGDIYFDNAVVKVAIQVRDAGQNTRVTATRVVLAALGDTSLAAEAANPASGECTTDTSTGFCVANLNLPADWFNIEGGVVTLQYGILGVGAPQTVGTVSLHMKHAYTVLNDVSLALPQRPLFLGESFNVDVTAQIGRGVKLFTIALGVEASGLSISAVSAPAKFGVSLSTTSGTLPSPNVTVGGLMVNGFDADLEDTAAPAEVLLTITIKVGASASLETLFTIGCNVIDLQDYNSVRAQPLGGVPGLATFVDRAGVSESTTSGSIFVATEVVSGMLGYASQGELVNMATLTGTQQIFPLTIMGFSVRGTASSVSGDSLTCTSSMIIVLQVTLQCTQVFFDGNELSGASVVTITAVHTSGLILVVPFRVWSAVFPVVLNVEDNELNVIQDWYVNSGSGCTARYQQTPVSVSVTFASGTNQQDVIVDATAVQANLVSSNPNIAAVQLSATNGLAVQGVAAGVVAISLTVNSIVRGNITMQVTETPVNVVNLEVTVLKSISLREYDNSFPSLENSTIVAALANQTLIAEFETAYVYSSVVFSDLRSEAVVLTDGLELVSLGPAVVAISGQNVQAIGNGEGMFVQGQLTSGACNSTVLGTGVGYVGVELPLPDAVIIDQYAGKLTVSSDAAAVASGQFAVKTTLRVRLEFPGSVFQTMTLDNRTVYDSSQANGLFRVEEQSGIPTIVTNASAGCNSGTGILTLSFQHVAVSASITIEIVCAASVSVTAHPFPAFSGSGSMTASTLAPFALSGVHQQAQLNTLLLFTDGSQKGITTAGQTSYTILNPGTTTINSSVVSVANAIVSKVDNGLGGTVVISAAFAGLATQIPFTLTVTDTPVDLVEMRMRGGAFTSTLRGGTGVSRARSNYDVKFSDNTWFNNVFEDSVTADPGIRLPHVITFQVPATQPGASVDHLSGIVTLLANHYALIPLTASLVGTTETIVHMFAANLDPVAIGDVDLGSALSLALPPKAVDVEFDVPVRFNSAQRTVAAVDIGVIYDSSLLVVVDCSVGGNWPGGNFITNVNNPPGIVTFGGLATPAFGSSSAHEVAVIRFKLTAAAAGMIVGLNVTVSTLIDVDSANVGASTPRAGIASVVSIEAVAGVARKRAVVADEALASPKFATSELLRRRRTPCANPPCTTCASPREHGDVNGDCVFDLKDAVFLTKDFLLPYATDPSAQAGYFLYSSFDADRNGIFEINDADFLARFNFKNLRFLSDLMVAPVTVATGCQLVINATMLDPHDVPAAGSTTFVFFDIELGNATLAAQFKSSALKVGNTVTAPLKGTPFSGGLWQAAYTGNGVFSVVVSTNITLANVGLSVLQVTTDVNGKSSLNRGLAMLGALNAADVTLPTEYPYDRPAEFDLEYSPVAAATGLVGLQLQITGVTEIPALFSRQPEAYRPLTAFSNSESTLACLLNTSTPSTSTPSTSTPSTSTPSTTTPSTDSSTPEIFTVPVIIGITSGGIVFLAGTGYLLFTYAPIFAPKPTGYIVTTHL